MTEYIVTDCIFELKAELLKTLNLPLCLCISSYFASYLIYTELIRLIILSVSKRLCSVPVPTKHHQFQLLGYRCHHGEIWPHLNIQDYHRNRKNAAC